MSKTDYLNISLDSLLAPLDLNLVSQKMEESEGISRLTSFDLIEAKEMVLLAAETWLARDLQEFESIEVEKEYKNGKARLDLVATHRGTMAPFDKTPGGKTIIDWKTTGTPVDSEAYRSRILLDYSMQWKRYCAAEKTATLFIYRALSRDAATYRGKGENQKPAARTKEFILEINSGHEDEVNLHYEGVATMLNSLIASKFIVWPRKMDREACFAYGSECTFYTDCVTNRMPLVSISDDKLKSTDMSLDLDTELSYSKMRLFMLCPERYRRTVLAQDRDKRLDTDSSSFGTVVHAGLSELWRQAFEI